MPILIISYWECSSLVREIKIVITYTLLQYKYNNLESPIAGSRQSNAGPMRP